MPSVLIADDNPDVRGVLASMLRRHGYDVTEAETGSDAVAALGRPFDAIVLDVRMPDGGGAFVVDAIEERDAARLRTVVLFTACGGDDPMVIAMVARGVQAHVQKPGTADQVLTAIRACSRDAASERRADCPITERA